jgi:hypothetical protein
LKDCLEEDRKPMARKGDKKAVPGTGMIQIFEIDPRELS